MSDRTPLVLLPGLLNDSRLWRDQIRGLTGLAEPQVADLTGQASVPELAAEVLRRAPDRFALAGLSMGGYVAFEILRQAPGRVSRLALLDTRPDPDSEAQKQGRRELIQMAHDGGFALVPDQLIPVLLSPLGRHDPVILEAVRGMAERVGAEAFERQQTAILNRADSRPLLPQIGVPTLVLCGREDQLTPVGVHREMAEAIPDAELCVIEEAGHLAPLERPDAVTRALADWLQGRPGGNG